MDTDKIWGCASQTQCTPKKHRLECKLKSTHAQAVVRVKKSFCTPRGIIPLGTKEDALFFIAISTEMGEGYPSSHSLHEKLYSRIGQYTENSSDEGFQENQIYLKYIPIAYAHRNE